MVVEQPAPGPGCRRRRPDDGGPRSLGTAVVSGLRSVLGRRGPARDARRRPRWSSRPWCEGLEHLVEGMAAGKGVIMALPHVGSWEYGGAFLATQGLPMTSVAERIEPPELFDFFVEQRAAMGLTIVPLDASSGSSIIATLRRGRAGRAAVRPGPGRQRHRGGVLRRDHHHAGRPGHPGPADRRPAGDRGGLQRSRAATTGPSSSPRSTPPARLASARTWPGSPRASPPGSRD